MVKVSQVDTAADVIKMIGDKIGFSPQGQGFLEIETVHDGQGSLSLAHSTF
jgi:hypothetical protein